MYKVLLGCLGRAIKNKFIKEVENGNFINNKKCLGCIRTCNPAETPYCITRALINSVKGDVDNGLLFVGSNAYRIDQITTVEKLMKELVVEAESCKF